MAKEKSWGARWIAPVDQPPLREASLSVVDGMISDIIPGGQKRADEDLGDVVMIPRLVNAHTHLEFGSLGKPIGEPGISITDWIPQVVQYRLTQTAPQTSDAVKAGLRESAARGTIAIGEIATSPWFNHQSFHDMVCTCFVERLGNDAERNCQAIAEAKAWFQTESDHLFQPGLSPHAPYSVNNRLLEKLIAWARADNLPVAMHLAESEEELLWLQTGKGPFLDLLQSLGALDEVPVNRRPMDYLRSLAHLEHVLVVHGNYLSGAELDLVASQSGFHIVFCPRTHRFFQHRPYPLLEMRSRGINVAVGTDSRASNPDLDVLAELQSIFRSFPEIPPGQILQMGTLNGARALQVSGQLGSLSIGKRAEFLTFPLVDPQHPLESILAAS